MDEAILRSINALAFSPVIAWVGRALSSGWMLPLVCGPILFLHLKKRRIATAFSIVLALGAGDLLTSRVLKPLVGRPRPCHTLEGLARPASCGPGKSFPSGHATVAFALAASAGPTLPYAALIVTPIAALVALSRVLLGVHYPSDIIAGAIVGTFVGLLMGFFRRRYQMRSAA